jgi:hypothetical protein
MEQLMPPPRRAVCTAATSDTGQRVEHRLGGLLGVDPVGDRRVLRPDVPRIPDCLVGKRQS